MRTIQIRFAQIVTATHDNKRIQVPDKAVPESEISHCCKHRPKEYSIRHQSGKTERPQQFAESLLPWDEPLYFADAKAASAFHGCVQRWCIVFRKASKAERFVRHQKQCPIIHPSKVRKATNAPGQAVISPWNQRKSFFKKLPFSWESTPSCSLYTIESILPSNCTVPFSRSSV